MNASTMKSDAPATAGTVARGEDETPDEEFIMANDTEHAVNAGSFVVRATESHFGQPVWGVYSPAGVLEALYAGKEHAEAHAADLNDGKVPVSVRRPANERPYLDELELGTFCADASGDVCVRVAEGFLLSDAEALTPAEYEQSAAWPVTFYCGAVGNLARTEVARRFVLGCSTPADERTGLWRNLLAARNIAVVRGVSDLPDIGKDLASVQGVRDLERVRQLVRDARPAFLVPTDVPVPAWADRVDAWEWQGALENVWQRYCTREWRWPEGGGVRLCGAQESHADGTVTTWTALELDIADDELASVNDVRDVARWLLEAADLLEDVGVGDDHGEH